jgi:hypothetical protein
LSRGPIRFRHEVIDPDPPGSQHDCTLLADLTGDGRTDVIIGCKQGDVNLFWYENPTWARHDMAAAPELEAGGVALDIAGNGRTDIVAGQQYCGHELYWFECPEDPRRPWTRRVIEGRFQKYHDQTVGDVDGDGAPEIVAVSQIGGVLFYYDIPEEPRVEPWPEECFHLVAEGTGDIEGLALADVDGDGATEIIAGPNVFRPGEPGSVWRREPFADDYVMTRVAVADLDADGALEIVLCEGESDSGRLSICRAPDYRPRVLRGGLFHPHSLAVADFTGDGRPDVFVGEMGLGRNPDPKLLIYINLGGGEFEERVISRGIPTHEAKVADISGDGRPDIVGKPYDPERHVDVWYNET